MTKILHIGRLHEGGLVLRYLCSSRCRHCLYACGPHRLDGEPEDSGQLQRVLDTLADRAAGARFHIGGDEPLFNLALVKEAIRGFRERGLILDYVETNSSWVRSTQQAVDVLEELADCGFSQVLVSVSPFHAEFMPPSKPRMLIEAANRVPPGGRLCGCRHFGKISRMFPKITSSTWAAF